MVGKYARMPGIWSVSRSKMNNSNMKNTEIILWHFKNLEKFGFWKWLWRILSFSGGSENYEESLGIKEFYIKHLLQ